MTQAANGPPRIPADDRLLNAVVQAENAMHALSVEVHYLSVGKPAERPSQSRD
jgi:hypothetical protein